MDVPETRYAETVDGVHIAYRVVGSGSIDLVWAPGTVSHVELNWEDPRLVRFIGRLVASADADEDALVEPVELGGGRLDLG